MGLGERVFRENAMVRVFAVVAGFVCRACGEKEMVWGCGWVDEEAGRGR